MRPQLLLIAALSFGITAALLIGIRRNQQTGTGGGGAARAAANPATRSSGSGVAKAPTARSEAVFSGAFSMERFLADPEYQRVVSARQWADFEASLLKALGSENYVWLGRTIRDCGYLVGDDREIMLWSMIALHLISSERESIRLNEQASAAFLHKLGNSADPEFLNSRFPSDKGREDPILNIRSVMSKTLGCIPNGNADRLLDELLKHEIDRNFHLYPKGLRPVWEF